MTLYELTEDYQRLLDLAETEDLDAQVFADTLEGLEGEIEIKADGYGRVIKQMEGDAKMLKAEESRLKARRESIERNTKKLKGALENAMSAMGKTKIKTELFSFWMQNNPASVVVDNPQVVPDDFWKPQDPVLDKEALKKYLTECGRLGLEIDWAHLEQSESLRMR